MKRKRKKLTPADVLNIMAVSIEGQATDAELAAPDLKSPVLREAVEASAQVLGGLAWSLTEAADAGEAAPVVELAEVVTEWLMKRKVGLTGLTLGQVATIDPSAN